MRQPQCFNEVSDQARSSVCVDVSYRPRTICHNNNYNIERGCSVSLSTGRLVLAATEHKEDKQKTLHPIFSFLIAAYTCRVCMRTNRKLKKIKNSIPDPQTLLCFQCCCQATLHYLKSNLPFLHLKHDEEQSDFDRQQEVFLMVKNKQTKLIKPPRVCCSSHARSGPEEHVWISLYVTVS